MSLSIRVLGSGTSAGVPTIGCECATCTSSDPRDTRLRPSILIRYAEAGGEVRRIVIDTTPDFRAQMLTARIPRLDAIIYTHDHADHILGLDDVRPFNYRQGVIPLYAAGNTLATIQRVFSYAFDDRKHLQYVPKLDSHVIGDDPFEVMGLRFEPIPVMHGRDRIYGFRFGNAAYLTDHSEVPEESVAKLGGLDVVFLDALRHREYPTHSTVTHAIETARRIGARRTFFTHMCHDLRHEETEQSLPEGMRLAYDGLEIEVNAAA